MMENRENISKKLKEKIERSTVVEKAEIFKVKCIYCNQTFKALTKEQAVYNCLYHIFYKHKEEIKG